MSTDAVVLVDPVSSGRFLKPRVAEVLGAKLIGVFTLTEEAFKTSGKYVPYAEMVEHCDVVISASDGNVDRVLREIGDTGLNVIACLPASEPGVELADTLAAALKLRGNDPSTSKARRNKYYMRSAVKAAGLRGPNFASCRGVADLSTFLELNGLPVVVKTPEGGGAHNVFVCRTAEEANAALLSVLGSRDIFGHQTEFALVEGFVAGHQYLIELFGDGKELHFASAWDLTLNKGLFYDLKLVTNLVPLQHTIDYCKLVGVAVGVTIGSLLVEVRVGEDGPTLIEVGARLTGIDAPFLVAKATTFDPFVETLKVYTDASYKMPEVRIKEYARMVFCPTEASGTLSKVNGMEEIRKLSSCVGAKVYFKEGERIVPSYDLATIPMCAFLSHPDPKQVEQDAAKARSLFSIEVV